VAECWSAPMGWAAVWKHQLRWARTIRVCQPVPYFFSFLSNASFWPLLWLIVRPAAPVVACAFEFQFLGGSMGSVVGERFRRCVDRAIQDQCGLVCFSATGGARMQEALLSLMQMAKTSAALARLARAGLPFISVMTDPPMGGVSASLAMLGDLNVAEPRALIGFAGPRVIQQTVRETLPEGFQRSEFLLEHGALDLIVDRRDMRDRLAALLRLMQRRPVLASA